MKAGTKTYPKLENAARLPQGAGAEGGQLSMRVFYTGDMANFPGWFRAIADGINLRLVEEPGEFSEGRTFVIFATHLGNVYRGHCNPRFVTEAAFQAFQAARAAGAR